MRKILAFILMTLALNVFAQSKYTHNFKAQLNAQFDSIDLKVQKSLILKNFEVDDNIIDDLEVEIKLGQIHNILGASGLTYKYFNFEIIFRVSEISVSTRLEDIALANKYFSRERRNAGTYYKAYFDKVVASARNKLIEKLKQQRVAVNEAAKVNIDERDNTKKTNLYIENNVYTIPTMGQVEQ